jgi:hypothetical protein
MGLIDVPPISRSELLRAAERLLAGAASFKITNKTAAHDIYEYWLWANVFSQAKHHPTIGVQLSGLIANRVSLRTSPSAINSGSFTHAIVTGTNATVAVHTGIYITGSSRANHEVDVAAVEADASGRARLTSGSTHPRWDAMRFGIEAKLRSDATLPLRIPRAVLGTAVDLVGCSTCLLEAGIPDARFLLATNRSLSQNGQRLLKGRSSSAQCRVAVAEYTEPRCSRSALNAFINRQLESL